jgi:shikimate dehydrogenase
VTPSATTRVAGVIGSPIRHSLSPAIHNAAYDALGLDWAMVAFEVAPGAGGAAIDALRTLDLVGLAVTMPHKHDAAQACDTLTDAAHALGVANTIWRGDDGRVGGDSTDGEGFRRSLVAAGHDPAGRSVLVLGAGGAARAVVLALAQAGSTVTVAARRDDAAAAAANLAPGVRAIAWAEAADAAAAHDVVVNATPIGMDRGDAGGRGATPVPPAVITARHVVVDLVYHPLETPLLAAARAAGATAVDGVGMLVHQAALQVERWSGRPAPVEIMAAAARQAIAG